MTRQKAEQKAKSIWGKNGQALNWAGRCEVGVYFQASIHHYPSFHPIESGKTFEEAFERAAIAKTEGRK